MDELLKYFPSLTPEQIERFEIIAREYPEWNEKINVISRKDIDNLIPHHILHSLAIARFMTPAPGTTFMDLGTGGGFPGIPLAIMWPQCRFHLIDRIGKKINVAREVAAAASLTNVTFQHGDAGECHTRFDYVVSRAVMPLPDLVKVVRRNISHDRARRAMNRLPGGLLCLKGGDLKGELAAVGKPVLAVPLSDYFREEFFATKMLIYVEL